MSEKHLKIGVCCTPFNRTERTVGMYNTSPYAPPYLFSKPNKQALEKIIVVVRNAALREDLHPTRFQRPALFIDEQRKESGLSKGGILSWEIRGKALEARESWENFWGLMRWL